jgi:hypothetical protein
MSMADAQREKIESLILDLSELIESGPADVKAEYQNIKNGLLELVNPQASQWTGWRQGETGTGRHTSVAMFMDAEPNQDLGLMVTFYIGQSDGKPVIQIDGSADFRVNVNDCPIWDQSTEETWSGGTNAAD